MCGHNATTFQRHLQYPFTVPKRLRLTLFVQSLESRYWRKPFSVPERLIAVSSMVPGFQSRAIAHRRRRSRLASGCPPRRRGCRARAARIDACRRRSSSSNGSAPLRDAARRRLVVWRRRFCRRARGRRRRESSPRSKGRGATWLRCRRGWRRILWRWRPE